MIELAPGFIKRCSVLQISVLNRVIYVGTVQHGKSTSDLEGASLFIHLTGFDLTPALSEYHRALGNDAGFADDQMRGILLHFSNDVALHLVEVPLIFLAA